ncbi:protein kinase [Streptomyces sp. 3MP-14]|uniref:non-specific serine/threonine protein kinase n=1 Tax=Streptomyces mimosae TaxID=2586635 RepID=A0A5N6A4H5_9ACTN|nr:MULTISPECIES: serine/threonine-protein kinase [Streptomyces]KAB8162879.1 protein kinase [Streptomyces mimosae]KAB8179092.1 protein kinase [Streptomyces sp. 3MP-14]
MGPGDELAGRYGLEEVMGTGRGGEVWLAHDRLVGERVVLKPVPAGSDGAPPVRRLGEPRALAKFRDHPHVVTLLDIVTVPAGGGGEAHWFVMEHVPGGGLDGRPPMAPRDVARLGAQLADALDALHAAGIVHCDVKPANVGLTRRGAAKLLDFGAAYRFRDTQTVTVNGPFSFTPDYAAPEVARGNIPRPASDVFSLAATLHALVTGAPPRGDDGPAAEDDDATDADTTDADTTEGGEALRRWRAEQGVVRVDAEATGPLAPVLTAMLRRDPRRRPDAAEAGRLLAAVAGPGGGAVGGEPDGDTEPGPERATQRPWRRRALLAGALGVAALVLALLLVPGGDGGEGGDDRAGGGPEHSTDDGPGSIGDPRTADLCELADAAALSRFGSVRLDADFGNFDQCDVLITPKEEDRLAPDSRIDVSLALRPGAPPEAGEFSRAIGEVGVLEGEPEDDECALTLVPPAAEAEELVVGLRVTEEDGPVAGGQGTLCLLAEAVAAGAADVLNEGRVPRLATPHAANSLVWTSACALLDAEALAGLPGLAEDEPEVGVREWSCEWANEEKTLGAEVAFHRDQPRTDPAGEPFRPHGFDTVIEEEGNGEGTCTAFVEYRTYGGRDADTYAEMVRVHVRAEPAAGRDMDQLCAAVRGLAEAAAAELPAA